MDKNFHRQFNVCPCCGSKDRFFEQLGNELKDRGLARKEWNFRMDVREGVVLDPKKADAIPIGSEAPAYGIMTDICMGCGCMYAIDLTRRDVKKSPASPQITPPGGGHMRGGPRPDDRFSTS